MKKFVSIVLGLIVLAGVVYIVLPGDAENRAKRLGVSYFDGDYVITHNGMSGMNVWLVIDGKVTSEPSKGYYHTRAVGHSDASIYLQVPIANTEIEEFESIHQLTPAQKHILVSKYGENAKYFNNVK
ncbi:MAG: hypothetical protein KUG78_02125 [Kangiellaceae bacterium]|nr:hypothetical protein [Kangiellaceae bacterium]